jgi:hypothetical protein
MNYCHKFGKPATIKIDMVDHPELVFAADRMLLHKYGVLFFLADRLMQLVPWDKVEHIWQE